MKKGLCIGMVFLICMLTAACGAPALQQAASPSPADTPAPTPAPTPEPVVVFTDTVLEGLIRKAMNKPQGDITIAEAEAVTELNLEMEGGVPIPRVADISDLKQFPNLTNLSLNWAFNDNNANDISALSGMTKLKRLYLCCDGISDLTPLKGMVHLKDLWIWGNRNITDISALSGMTGLNSLWIKGNQITDISALSGMKELTYLCMEENQIADITPLSGLSKLKTLLLSNNPIEDFSPITEIYPNLEEKDFELK